MPDLQNIKRNSNDFSFTDTAASLVNNKEYRSGYQDLIDGRHNDKTYFWEALSAVGDELGETLYENVLNYVNNAANINTCKLRALTSIAKVLGVTEFAILKNLDTVPPEVLNLMDIFSINKAYLLNINNFDSEFVKDLISECLNEETLSGSEERISSDLNSFFDSSNFPSADIETATSSLNFFGSLSEAKYEKFVEDSFFKLICSKLFQTYGDRENPYKKSPESNSLVFQNLTTMYDVEDLNFFSLASLRYRGKDVKYGTRNTKILNSYYTGNPELSGDIVSAEVNYYNRTTRYKQAFNVRKDFNESKIVDAIEMGEDFIDNYSGPELSVLKLEISERSKRMYSEKGYATDPTTRYAYYKERDVLNYYRFINDTIMLYNTSSIVERDDPENPVSMWSVYTLQNNFNPYRLNTNYSEITLSDNYTLSDSIAFCENVVKDDPRFSEFSSFIFDYYEKPDEYKNDETLSAGTTYLANAVKMTAYILKEICMAIVNLRETLKTQAQRNYMTGTKLLMEYVLNEYVANFLINNYGVSKERVNYSDKLSGFGIVIQEYNDCTEYFNIGNSIVDDGKMDYSVNASYFYDFIDNPNTGTTVDANGLTIWPDTDPAESIRRFYLSTLNIESEFIKAEDYYDFMSAVYEVGISKTLIGKNGSLVIDKKDLSDLLDFSLDLKKIKSQYNLTDEDIDLLRSTYLISSENGYLSIDETVVEPYLEAISSEVYRISSDVEVYNSRLSSRIDNQQKLVLTYGGRDFDYYPWYNYKNQNYPTFQAHPYLNNFIEHDNEKYPIENAFYGSTNEEYLEELQSKTISVYLEEYGNLRRIWRSGALDFSGYKSKYEYYSHTAGPSNANLLYSVQHYDGTFYPPAIELYHKYFYNELSEKRYGRTITGLELLSVHMLEGVRNGVDGKRKDIPTISSMWDYYSQLYLSENETQHIVDQLLGLSADIMRMSSYKYRKENGLKAQPYDIFKYGLDYNDNSLILLKQYSKNQPSYSEKTNTRGELWVRFSGHPIGFPAMLPGQNFLHIENDKSLQQFNLEKPSSMEKSKLRINGLLRSYARTNNVEVYDFGLSKSRKNLVFAIPNPIQKKRTYRNALHIPVVLYESEILEDKTNGKEKFYFPLESETTFLFPGKGKKPSSLDMAELPGIKQFISDSDGYEFDGYLQANSDLYLGYVRKNARIDGDTLSSIQFNVLKYPGKNDFEFKTDNAITDFGNLETLPTIDSAYKLGYIDGEFRDNGTFTLAINAEIPEEEQIEIQNFVGHNTVTSDLEPEKRGKTELLEATSGDIDVTGEYDSFDRFADYVLLYDIDENYLKYRRFEDGLRLNVYGLNSDASYIPQYYGLDGQNLFYLMKDENGEKISYNKEWYNEELVPIQSLELLGYTFQRLDDEIKDKQNSLHLDEETGKITDYNKDALLKNTLRVYEDYNMKDYVSQTSNSSQRYTTDLSDSLTSFTAILPIEISGIDDGNLSNYNVLLLNTSNGQNRNPILAGTLSYDLVNNPLYDSDPSEDETSILSTGYGISKRLRVVGTPNPFVLSTGTFAYDYSNHIFGIAGLETELIEENGRYAVSVKFVISESAKKVDFVLQSGILNLFVYKNTLDEFEKYHYMEPFGEFPHNAALSSWLVPWKDKAHGYLYLDDYLSSDEWRNVSAYMADIRRVARNNKRQMFDELCAGYGISSYHVVGNLPHSAYNENNDLCIDLSDSRLMTLSLMENVDLSSIVSFDDSYYLSTGQITWKISEEDVFDYLKNLYPPRIIDDVLYRLFGNTNKSAVKFNIFDLSNTYIFQLEDPERIAERIATIAVPIGSPSEQFDFVYEDYLSDQVNVDRSSKNMVYYCETLYDLSNDGIKNTDGLEESDSHIQEMDSIVASNSISSLDNALSVMEVSGFYEEDSEDAANVDILDYEEVSVTAKEISEYLKLYVNWRKYSNDGDESQSEIELFFNLPNLFMSPYSYRTVDGTYSTEYKENTYLRLKSGEDGYLYVVFQFKYYDMAGILRGVRDLPILTYHIFNVSDDKPKFVITKTYEIDNRDGKFKYPGDNGNSKVFIVVNSKTVPYSQLDPYLGWNWMLKYDLSVNTNMQVISPIPLKYLNFEMLYERGKQAYSTTDDDPEFVFEPTISRPGDYSEDNTTISGHFNDMTYESTLEFTLLAGSMIDENTQSRTFPIEVLTAYAEDINGNKPEFIFINGSITFDENNQYGKNGAYLAREMNQTSATQISAFDNPLSNAGWINEEVQRALIRMYNLGRASSDVAIYTENEGYLKTEGTRNSRFDRFADRPILRAEG